MRKGNAVLWRAGLAGLLALAAGSTAAPVRAQDDVTWLGERYGTTPPAEYYRLRAERPSAFTFSRAWIARNPRLALQGDGPDPQVEVVPREDLPQGRTFMGPEPIFGRRDGQVAGTFRFPLILGLFGGETTPARYTREQVQAQFFDGPNPKGGTITSYYSEVSGGRVELLGETQPWVRSSLSRAQVTGNVSGLGGPSQVAPFIVTLLQQVDDGSIDWGRFDNDGPDGIPNSGDDDGFVDVLAVMHPTAGAECTGAKDMIWSHRWSIAAGMGSSYVTASPSANGGSVRVNDYTIQPVLACNGSDINDIGVFAHELGHGFGLPDLYCTGGNCGFGAVGEWGLMGSGAWGCRGNNPGLPCHMSPWSKEVLGWVDVEVVPPGTDLGTVALDPVVSSGRVLRYDIPGTEEYYLLEYRAPAGFDIQLRAAGLLVWHVDDGVLAGRWGGNGVNSNAARQGVRVVQADGQAHLQTVGGGRGDAGDPFPGSTNNTSFHAGTLPGAYSNDGWVSGLTLLDLGAVGQTMNFRLLTRLQAVALSTVGDGGTQSLLSVDGGALPPGGGTAEAAPYQTLRIRAEGGELLAPGIRSPFQGWADGFALPDRDFQVGFADTAFVAAYGGREVQVDVALSGEEFGVAPGTIGSDPASPGLWFPEGTAVTLTARPTRGFAFQEWTGALAGAPNPVGLVVDAPVSAGAVFTLSFDVPDPGTLQVAAGDQVVVGLTAANSSPPVRWTIDAGGLPLGLNLSESGWITGSPLVTGSYAFQLRARDALGLEGTASVTLVIGEPDLPFAVVAGSLLGNGNGPTVSQALYLDRSGNGNGILDVGDVRAYLLRAQSGAPVAPATGELRKVLELVRMAPGGGR